jgi:hypothetical protein
MKIRPVIAELFHADGLRGGQTDMTQLIVAFEILRSLLQNAKKCFCGDFISTATIKILYKLNKKFLVFYVKCQIVLSDFNQMWSLSTNFHKSPQYQILRKSVQCERRERRTDGRT